MDLRGKTALVTGASSGIGAAMARRLAAQGAGLVITARRRERLEALASEITAATGRQVTVVVLDLSAPEAPEALYQQTEGSGRTVQILVNNAGFGTAERFLRTDWATLRQQIQLNITSLSELTWRFGRAMEARDEGWILNVASIGAYLPSPGYASYAAGKAYVRNFSEAVAYELRKSRVVVTCLCPGATRTEFMAVAGHELAGWQARSLMSAERCAKIGLRALFRGRRNVVAGFGNTFAMFLLRFLPRKTATWIAGKVLEPSA